MKIKSKLVGESIIKLNLQFENNLRDGITIVTNLYFGQTLTEIKKKINKGILTTSFYDLGSSYEKPPS
jgi:hypothetical protein